MIRLSKRSLSWNHRSRSCSHAFITQRQNRAATRIVRVARVTAQPTMKSMLLYLLVLISAHSQNLGLNLLVSAHSQSLRLNLLGLTLSIDLQEENPIPQVQVPPTSQELLRQQLGLEPPLERQLEDRHP